MLPHDSVVASYSYGGERIKKILKRIAWLEYALFKLLVRLFFFGKRRRDEFIKRKIVDIDHIIDHIMHKHFLDRNVGFIKQFNEKEAYYFEGRTRYIIPLDCTNVVNSVKRFYLKPNKKDVVIDAGAHYGFYTILASRLVGNEGNVLAFEPHPHNYKRLLTNLRLNGIKNVKTFNLALGEINGQTKLHLANSGGHSTTPESSSCSFHGYIPVKVATIDTVMKKLGVQKVSLIKIDVEGAELSVMKGGSRTIKKSKPKLTIASYHFPNESTEIKEWFETHYPMSNIKIKDDRFVHVMEVKWVCKQIKKSSS